MKRIYHTLRGYANTSTAMVRSETYEGRPYLIVPVVCMVGDSVVWPVNAPAPEFVPYSVLAAIPAGWNGRPVLPLHPDSGTGSANTPEVLAKYAYGKLFNTHVEHGALQAESWLDIERAKDVPGATRVIERCQRGEVVEISVGAYVYLREEHGERNGKTYEAVWEDVIPDHLAMFPDDSIGACSVEMGCGAPRVAAAHVTAPHPISTPPETSPISPIPSSTKGGPDMNPFAALRRLIERMASASALGPDGITSAAEDSGASDMEIRNALHELLRASEPAFDWIIEVYPDSLTCIYTTCPNNEYLYWRRSYVVGTDGQIALGDVREQVMPSTEYEVVGQPEAEPVVEAASANAAHPDAPCACHKVTPTARKERTMKLRKTTTPQPRAAGAATPTAAPLPKGRAATVAALLSLASAPFGLEDETRLLSLNPEALSSLYKVYAAAPGATGDVDPATAPVIDLTGDGPDDGDDTAEPAASAAAPVPAGTPAPVTAPAAAPAALSSAEWLARAPRAIRSQLERLSREEGEYRADLVEALAEAQDEYDAKALAARPTADLESLARLLKLEDIEAPEAFPREVDVAPRRASAKVTDDDGDDDGDDAPIPITRRNRRDTTPREVDYSLSRNRGVRKSDADDSKLNPPNSYADGIKKLQARNGLADKSAN